MYSNVFDTVRTDVGQRVNFEGLMYTSILNGLHPTLSLTQAIDSKPLVELLTNPQYGDFFLSFIRNDRIRVSKFINYANEERPITQHFLNQLIKNADKPESFYFSSLPFLKPTSAKYSNPDFDNEAIKIIFGCMRDAIGAYQNMDDREKAITSKRDKAIATFEENTLLPNSFKTSAYFKKVRDHIKAVIELEAAIYDRINNYPLSDFSGKKDLHTRFIEYYAKYHEMIHKQGGDANPNFTGAIDNLYAIYHRPEDAAAWNNRNNRTYIYSLIDSLGCESDTEFELKSLIDFCYNETVAASIYDGGEHEILSFDHRLSTVNHYQSTLPEQECLDTVREEYSLLNTRTVKTDSNEASLRESQIRDFSDNVEKFDSYRHFFTWEIMKSLFDEIGWKELPDEEWNRTIQLKCEEYSQKLKLNRNKLITGYLYSVSTILLGDFSASTLLEPSLGSKLALPIVVLSIGSAALNQFNQQHYQQPTLSNKEVVEARAKAKLAKELLTNVSTLRKDLNGGKADDDKQTD